MPQFPLDLKNQVILVGTTLIGPKRSHNVVLILDTGATYSMIAPEILVRIGIDHSGSPPPQKGHYHCEWYRICPFSEGPCDQVTRS